ncbi:MAG: hypothetical protein Kow00114_14620 [Kiloniellaceae bacterium]
MSRAMSSGSKTPRDSRPAGPQAPAKGTEQGAESRQARLAQALRDNLKKRKAQQRERKNGPRGRRDDGA